MLDILSFIVLLGVAGELGLLLKKKPRRTRKQDKVILDSCALIDGRVIDLVRCGFLSHELVVPKAVLAELQYLADQGDTYKRERARYGLDIAKQLQEETTVSIAAQGADTSLPVDEQLIKLAKAQRASLYTTDFNLNKVARIEGVHVLNINELSQLLRPHLLPGEVSEVKIIDKGETRQQGVGYMPDGTMVVVDKAGHKIGHTIKVEFTRILQTQAGRMMFATALEQDARHSPQPRRRGNSGRTKAPSTDSASY